MKRMMGIIGVLAVAAAFTGCYKNVSEEVASPEFREVALEMESPSQAQADLVVIAHLKKRLTNDPYTFALKVDGKEVKETVQGVDEQESSMLAERGEGTYYSFVKRFRLEPGKHTISLVTEDGHAFTKRELTGGHVYTVIFEPVYGPRRFASRTKDFRKGVIDFSAKFDVTNHLQTHLK